MKLKVYFVIYSLSRGGAEKVFSILANNIDKNVFEVTFITLRQYIDQFHLNDDIEKICLEENKSILAIKKIYELVKKGKPNIIFSTINQISIIVGFVGSIHNFFSKKKIMLIMRETSIPSIYIKRSKYPSWFLSMLIKIIYPKFDTIISQGNFMKQDLVINFQIKPDKIKIINNPIEKKKYVINKKNGFTLVTVGNLTSIKGYDRLLKILYIIKEKIDFKYYIIGDGPNEKVIKGLIVKYNLEKECIMTGAIDNVLDYLSSSDLFLQGSYFEGFPNALLEANQVGLPVVAFDVPGGTNEIIQNGSNGFLVKDGDINGYVDTVLIALSQSFNKEDIINSTNNYSKEKIIKEYETMFIEKCKLLEK